MKWKAKDPSKWKKKFLLFPRKIDGWWYWLEYAEKKFNPDEYGWMSEWRGQIDKNKEVAEEFRKFQKEKESSREKEGLLMINDSNNPLLFSEANSFKIDTNITDFDIPLGSKIGPNFIKQLRKQLKRRRWW